MPLKLADATISTFDCVFDKFKVEALNNKINFILFLADNDPSTSWCPDSYVGDRRTWRNAHHPWKVYSKFKLTGVPTLICWENDVVKDRLEDHEDHIESKINALLVVFCITGLILTKPHRAFGRAAKALP
ncbi:unnamed protein product [Malus baccata var. baccata]